MLHRILILLLTFCLSSAPCFSQGADSAAGELDPQGNSLQEIPEPVRARIPAPDVAAESWMLVDFHNGWILGSKDRNLSIEPASLTKLMTGYLIFEALENGEISLDDMVYVSKKAWRTKGSRMFIQVDTHVSVDDLIKGLIIQSGNDAAVALAEFIGGSEEGFAIRMNLKAAELGMKNSNFTNSHGLPDKDHYSTAEDILILSRALIRDHPERLGYYSTREFTYNDITQKNRNILLWRDPSVDGLKTGYTKAAGYCLVGTADRDGMRLVAIVTGATNRKARADAVHSLLQYGFATYEQEILFKPGDEVSPLRLWMSEEKEASVGVTSVLSLILPKGRKDSLSTSLELPESIDAPLTAGTVVGNMQVRFDDEPFLSQRLQLNEDYPEGPWWSRVLDYFLKMVL